MLDILEFAKEADNISTLASMVMVALFTICKIGWDFWKRLTGKETPEERKPHSQETGDVDTLEIMSSTYIGIIKNLRTEVDKLKQDIILLTVLKEENFQLRVRNEEQGRKIKILTTKVNRLLTSQSNRNTRRK